jgi:hypothetical protein
MKEPAENGLYRDANRLVVREGTRLPDRCVICNGPIDDDPIDFVFKREKSHYIEIAAVQTVVTAAADLLTGAKYTGPVEVSIPFCRWHRQRRLRRLGIGAGLMALAVAILFVRYLIGGASEFTISEISIYIVIAVLVATTGVGIILDVTYDPAKLWFKTKKFHGRFVWLEGAGPQFLKTLPRLDGKPETRSPRPAEASSKKKKRRERDSASKRPDAGGDEANLSADELIRRARHAGVDDED